MQTTCSSCLSPATKPTASATTFFKAPALHNKIKNTMERDSVERGAIQLWPSNIRQDVDSESRRLKQQPQHGAVLCITHLHAYYDGPAFAGVRCSRTPIVVSQKSPCATSFATFAPMSTPQCMPPKLSLRIKSKEQVKNPRHTREQEPYAPDDGGYEADVVSFKLNALRNKLDLLAMAGTEGELVIP